MPAASIPRQGAGDAGGNPSAWWEVEGGRTGHDVARTHERVGRLLQGNDHVGLQVETIVDPACDAWIAPIETISNSESGFERVYQGSALLLSQVVALEPGESIDLHLEHRVTVATDRAAAEDLPVPGPA